jgi:hypothetical protein
MRRLGGRLAYAAAMAGLLIGFAGTPALADHDDDDRRGRHYGHSDRHDSRGYRRHHERYYDRGYYRGYYYQEPRVEYYAAPRIYVPLPPSIGFNLVFPWR